MSPRLAPSLLLLLVCSICGVAPQEDHWVDVIVPPKQIDQEDTYVCINVNIPENASRLLEVQPLAEQQVVHHMLLFGMYAVVDAFHKGVT